MWLKSGAWLSSCDLLPDMHWETLDLGTRMKKHNVAAGKMAHAIHFGIPESRMHEFIS